jgi:hypothetical protein
MCFLYISCLFLDVIRQFSSSSSHKPQLTASFINSISDFFDRLVKDRNEIISLLSKSLNIFYETSHMIDGKDKKKKHAEDGSSSRISNSGDVYSHFTTLLKLFLSFKASTLKNCILLPLLHEREQQKGKEGQKRSSHDDEGSEGDLLSYYQDRYDVLSQYQEINGIDASEETKMGESILSELLGIPLPLLIIYLPYQEWILPYNNSLSSPSYSFLASVLSEFSISLPSSSLSLANSSSGKSTVDNLHFQDELLSQALEAREASLQATVASAGNNRRKGSKNKSSQQLQQIHQPPHLFQFLQCLTESLLLKLDPFFSSSASQAKKKAFNDINTTSRNNESLSSMVMRESLASKGALSEIQQEVYSDLFERGKKKKDGKSRSSSSSSGRRSKERRERDSESESDEDDSDEDELFGEMSPLKQKVNKHRPSHLINETNKVINQQRIDSLNAYLETLHLKAVKKKNLLKTLMELWNATKIMNEDRQILPSSDSPSTSIKKSRKDRLLHTTSLSSNRISFDDIYFQTTAIQDILIKDMQQPSSVKLSQVRGIFGLFLF